MVSALPPPRVSVLSPGALGWAHKHGTEEAALPFIHSFVRSLYKLLWNPPVRLMPYTQWKNTGAGRGTPCVCEYVHSHARV